MAPQRYSNHVRYYTPHHFIFYPVLLVAVIISIRFVFVFPHQAWIWGAVAFVFLMMGWLSFMMRQHYALTVQNRIVRLELRLRYFQLANRRLEEFEDKLSFGQIAALRFAPDEELVSLTDRSVGEQLSPKQIKKAILNWLPDHMRV